MYTQKLDTDTINYNHLIIILLIIVLSIITLSFSNTINIKEY